MTKAAAALYNVNSFDGRSHSSGASSGAGRRIVRAVATHAGLCLAAVAAVGLAAGAVTLSAAWMLNATLSANSRIHAKPAMGPGMLALVRHDQTPAGANFETRWARAPEGALPRPIDVPESANKAAIVRVVSPARVAARASEHAEKVRLPRANPAPREVAPPAQVAAAVPPPVIERPPTVKEAHNKTPQLADIDRRTAVYDISARTVYMPNGDKLEAHSGLGEKMDDPQYIKLRMRGPTPPNVYELTMRERLFHGVRAIRLNPVDEGRMFGRDGMLAHSYMLGPNGQSNGCVSFRNYDKFLTAFLNGEVDRLVVVPELGGTPWRTAVAEHSHIRRFAAGGRTSVVASATSPATVTGSTRSSLTW